MSDTVEIIETSDTVEIVADSADSSEVGVLGPPGTAGSPGADSTVPGPQGDSAYQVWLDAGNSGTVEDYLDSLQGEDASATVYTTEAQLDANFTPGRGQANVNNGTDWPTLYALFGGFGPVTIMVETMEGNGTGSTTQKINDWTQTFTRSAYAPFPRNWSSWYEVPGIPSGATNQYLTLNGSGDLAWESKLVTIGNFSAFSSDDGQYTLWAVNSNDLGADTGLSDFDGFYLYRAPGTSQQVWNYTTNEASHHQVIEVSHPTLGAGKISRQRVAVAGSFGAWSDWEWSTGSAGIPTYIQQSEPVVTGPAIWYETDGSGNVVKKWIQTS